MTDIGFIGLGNMGAPMARNLVAAGHSVRGFDVSAAALDRAVATGVERAPDLEAAAAGVEVVVTMLPAGAHVREVYLDSALLDAVEPATLLIDCSTIDVETARAVHKAAADRGFDMADAPVSGGVAGAEKATLTFMVGGSDAAFARGEPILSVMGKTIVHAGGPGTGQAAKICNNMMLGIQMISVAEGFVLAERLGLDAGKLFDISSRASGQCWSLTSYCPVPGPVPAAPSNRDYEAGFTAAMMLKDLILARDAAGAVGTDAPLGRHAAELYERFVEDGNAGVDFSGIIRMIRGR
ncbi:MAG: 3-hydroxyisobutyrate dehydrogenase [Alphaproteobacteria bacterium]